MRHLKVLKTIFLIFGFGILFFGCVKTKPVSDKNQNSTIELSAKTTPEGILLSFSNFAAIPAEIAEINIYIQDWGNADASVWDKPLGVDFMTSMSIMRESYCEKSIEQIKKTGSIVFPFVQSGHKYRITAYFLNREYNVESSISTECTADSGIYLNKDITLTLNPSGKGVSLSGDSVFSSEVQLMPYKLSYMILCLTGDYTDAFNSGSLTDDFFWDFEPMFSAQLKDAGVTNGDYPAFVTANLHIAYDNNVWMLDIAKTPVFTYSF